MSHVTGGSAASLVRSANVRIRTFLTRVVRPAVAGLAVAGLAACGGGASSPTTPPPRADVVITALDGIRWDAPTYTAAATNGQVVIQGRNSSNIPHNLYVIAADGVQVPGHLDLKDNGDVETETLPLTPGKYTVICKIPGHNNMKATLTIT